MIGSAVGFANVLSFSALCYKNGGGAFLIPYLLAHLLIGIPMLFLEGTIGQKSRLPLVSAIASYGGGRLKAFGWFAVLTCATIGGFYIVLTGFSVAYTYFSARNMIGADSAYFFKHTFLKDSGSLTTLGSLSTGVFVATIVVAIISWIVLSRKIQSGVEKLCTIFLPLLAVLMLTFTVATCFLPGASIGFVHYLLPDFSALKNLTLWRDVFGQVFFSLSLGLGIVTGYSRHNKSSFSIPRAMVKVAIGDVVISLISGFAIFGCIGFMSLAKGIPFSSIVTSDSAFEIGFVIFPMILSTFHPTISSIIGPLFFFCVFIAGITGVFSIAESIAGNFEVEFKKSRKVAVSFAIALLTLLALPFCMGNGQHLLGAIAPMVLGNAMLIGGIFEILFFLSLTRALKDDTLWYKGLRATLPNYALGYIVLPLLAFSLLACVYTEFFQGPPGLDSLIRWGWLTVAFGFSIALTYSSKERTVVEQPSL